MLVSSRRRRVGYNRDMASTSYRRTAGQDLLRQLLEDARRREEHVQASAERLRTLIRAGELAGLKPSQLAEASGLSRPGIYEVRRGRAQGPIEGLEDIVLAAIGAAGGTTRTALRDSLRVPEEQVNRAIARLGAEGAISFGLAGYGREFDQEVLLLSVSGEEILDHRLRRLLSSKPESWTAYIAVDEGEAQGLAEAARQHVGRHRTALLPSTTRSDMRSPELALSFDVSDEVALFNEAARVWHTVREAQNLPPTPPRFTAFVAPQARSSVLESFGRAAAEVVPEADHPIMRAVAESAADEDDRDVCIRGLTEAASALRRSVSQSEPPPRLANADAAFAELQAVVGLRLDEPREKIQRALSEALERATERLGPFPGGRAAAVREPGELPNIVEEVKPTHADLVAIAQAAGRAVGYAHLATDAAVNAVEAVREVAGTRMSP